MKYINTDQYMNMRVTVGLYQICVGYLIRRISSSDRAWREAPPGGLRLSLRSSAKLIVIVTLLVTLVTFVYIIPYVIPSYITGTNKFTYKGLINKKTVPFTPSLNILFILNKFIFVTKI